MQYAKYLSDFLSISQISVYKRVMAGVFPVFKTMVVVLVESAATIKPSSLVIGLYAVEKLEVGGWM